MYNLFQYIYILAYKYIFYNFRWWLSITKSYMIICEEFVSFYKESSIRLLFYNSPLVFETRTKPMDI